MDPNNNAHPNYNQIPTMDSLCTDLESINAKYFVFSEDKYNSVS